MEPTTMDIKSFHKIKDINLIRSNKIFLSTHLQIG